MGSAITGMTGLAAPLPITNGGTAADTAAGARTNLGLGTAATQNVGTSANNVVQLNGSSQLPAVSGALLTNLPAPSGVVTAVSDTDTGTSVAGTEVTFLSVAKTITSGKTVLLLFSGYYTVTSGNFSSGAYITWRLKSDGVTSGTFLSSVNSTDQEAEPGSGLALVTGLSGSVTFTVTGQGTGNSISGNAKGRLIVLEF